MKALEVYTLQAGRVRADITNLGARVMRLLVDGTDVVQGFDRPDDYLPENDSYYEFEPIPAEDAKELMTYELTIPYKERNHFEEILRKIGFPCCFS